MKERKCSCGKMFIPPKDTTMYCKLEYCPACVKERIRKIVNMPLNDFMKKMGKQVIK